MRARGYEPSADGEAIQYAGPKRWVRNILTSDIDPLTAGQAHDFVSQVLLAIIDAEVSAVALCRCYALISAGAGDDFRAEHLRNLYAAASKGTGGAHD